jgi:hypothetical protein
VASFHPPPNFLTTSIIEHLTNSKKMRGLTLSIKSKLYEYTESEYTNLITRLFDGDYTTEAELDEIVETIVITSEHPNGSDVMYHPPTEAEDSPEGVLNTIKTWRAANGKSGFKAE